MRHNLDFNLHEKEIALIIAVAILIIISLYKKKEQQEKNMYPRWLVLVSFLAVIIGIILMIIGFIIN